MREGFKIVALSVFAAIGYGIIHDQITVRVCLEYFTVGHPPIFSTTSPTLLALGWGVIATWWVGALLGFPLVAMARVGAMPKLAASELTKPIMILMAASGLCAFVAGGIGFILARNGVLHLAPALASRISQQNHDVFLADLWAHNASYLAGFAGGVLLIARVYCERRRRFIGQKSELSVVK